MEYAPFKTILSTSYKCVLVVDVIQPLTDERKVAGNTKEASIVFQSIVSALRLHSSKGLAYEYTYQFRSPPISSTSLDELPEVIKMLAKESPGCTILRPHTVPALFSPLGRGLSVLREDQYDDCRSTFHKLLKKEWNDTDTFDKVLQLALEYHRTSFALENIEHAFLILVVALEALFKKKDEKLPAATARITKLLASNRDDKRLMNNHFKYISDIRDDIAHGDPNLDYAMVKEYFPKLYHHITNAIIALLNLPNGTIDAAYYDDLTRYVDNRSSTLPQNAS